ncbi:MAG TPA: hypothetical protein VGE59_02110 [Patescibacteria group bacterium]
MIKSLLGTVSKFGRRLGRSRPNSEIIVVSATIRMLPKSGRIILPDVQHTIRTVLCRHLEQAQLVEGAQAPEYQVEMIGDEVPGRYQYYSWSFVVTRLSNGVVMYASCHNDHYIPSVLERVLPELNRAIRTDRGSWYVETVRLPRLVR